MTATVTSSILGLVNAALQLVVSFGVNVSDSQNAAITGLVNAALIVIALVWDNIHRTPSKPVAGQ